MSEKKQLQNYVDGAFVSGSTGEYLDVINPSTGEVYATAPLSGAEDVDAAMQAAQRAFGEWGRTTPSERMNALLAMADAVESHAEQLVA